MEGRIRDLMIFRVIIVTAILGMGILFFERADLPYSLIPLYSLIIGAYIITLFFWFVSKLNIPSNILLYIQITTDILIETGFVYFTGGITSQFSVLYGLSILSGSFYLHLKGGLIFSTLASIAYAAMAALEQTGNLPRVIFIEFVSEESPVTVGSYVFLKVYLHICFFYLVGVLSGYLAERAKRKGKEAYEAKEELTKVRLNTDDILQNMNSGLITVDANGNIVSFNKTAKMILGCAAAVEDLEGTHFYTVLNKNLEPLGDVLSEILEENSSKDYFEMEIERNNGDRIPLGVKTTYLQNNNDSPRGVIMLFDDLTEKKKLEERIRRSDRLAAVGKLSAGIAHEIKNPLASMSGAIQYLQEDAKFEGTDKRLFNLILRESGRLNKLIDNFLYFARLKAGDIEDFRLKQLVEEVVMLLKNEPKLKEEKVDFNLEIPDNFRIRGSSEQIEQMLLNLSLNSIQAMDYHGAITYKAYSTDDKNVISITDTGTGMSEEIQKQIYEPFFTTRKGGSGLGLAIVNRIVENHHGDISIHSEVDKGTEFIIKIPKDLNIEEGE